jgi:membrane dipeptidase
MVDMSHLNERGFWDVASVSAAPLVVTHACANAYCRSTRNLTDQQLDAIKESHGVIGFNFSVCDIRPDAKLTPDTPIEMVVDHLSYIVDRVGEDHVALGSDFDGALMPYSLRDASYLPELVREMRCRGFGETLIRNISFNNWMRVFRATWR